MASEMVKEKLRLSDNFRALSRHRMSALLAALALLTFILSWLGAFPAGAVERWYARGIFPMLSGFAGRWADAVPFSWLDAAVGGGVAFAVLMIYRRRFLLLGGAVAAAYLLFFWSWGLNYHRLALAQKLPVETMDDRAAKVEQFKKRAAEEINRLHVDIRKIPYDEERVQTEAAVRVARVVEVIDGSKWDAATRIKTSRLVNPWFRVASIDGLFNPFGHEPIINNSLLETERPFVIAHELAHVRGYPEEGDANFIGVLATVVSGDPHLQYSGWLHLWLYLRDAKLDELLDEGPRADLGRIFERMHAGQIRWLSDLQAAILDWYLKANNVEEGIRSYSHVVLLAVGTEGEWERFR